MTHTYTKLSEFIFDCNTCPARCDGKSKMSYIFNYDAAFSEGYEQRIIDKINSTKTFTAAKCDESGYPDVVMKQDGNIYAYLEVKVQQRTFMSVSKALPDSKLLPSETIALNLSDLLRYFTIKDTMPTPIYIVWVLLNRACIVPLGKTQFYFQDVELLRKIYEQQKDNRRFRRKSGDGDVVNGVHKGVTVNYHFSLNELKKWEF